MPHVSRFAALALAVAATPVLAAAGPGAKNADPAPPVAAQINHPIPANLLATLHKASQEGLGLSRTPDHVYLRAINGPRLNGGDKVGLLYIGADFCPYCAGQRWALVLTLVRFGKLDGLEYMASSPHDVYPNTPTFSFQHATYDSKYIAFYPVETADRMGKPLKQPNKAQNAIFNTFDKPPYTPGFGSIPFVYVDGQYMLTRPLVLPGQLSGMDWGRAATAFANPGSGLFQSVMPQVNALTAAICRLDGGNPDDICSAPGVTAANGALLRMGAAGGS